MARNFRQSRFTSRGRLGEDVNPSAYIVNLADCMLVLACGFMVALISYWNVNISNVSELTGEQLEQVSPEQLPEEITSDGSYYIEAGKVYRDPNTGLLYMVQSEEESDASGTSSSTSSSTSASSSSSTSKSSGSSSSSAGSQGSSSSSGMSEQDIVNARAAGAD